LCRSYHKRRAIRVFRSSSLNGKFASPYLDEDEDDEIGYRYDGLYMVRAVWDVHGNETEAFPSTGAEGWQTYFFTRLPKKPLDGRTEPGMQYNSMGLQELWGSIQKMRGVRRPKKFEIPQAPMTLPPMKMSAITGDYKDRKSATYRPPVVQEPIQEKTLPEKASNDGRKKQPEPPLFDSSSDEEAPEQPRGAAKRSESTSPSRSERSPKIAPRPIPNKVVTPRPRLSSNAQELKKTATSLAAKRMASTESDSSDSESEHPVHPKRPKVEYPKLVSSSPTKRPNNLAQVISTLLPKRATAAKAEAANRDMLGKKKKRPSSRSSTSAASSPRKRPRRSKQDDDSSSLSINGVDPDILTVGSRVLVQYKGSLFKATIRKRREKNGKHDFQIHYDGNKKSNVHWVAVDRIDKILYIAIDTSAATKSVGNKKSKRGGWNKKKSESDEENDTDHSDDESVHSKEIIESKTAASPKRKPEETEEEPEETEVKPEETEAKPEEEHAKPSGESSYVPAKPTRGSPASVRSKTPLEDDDTEEVSTVAASKGSDEEMLRKETNETIATTSTNNFKRNRVTVFDDVQVARGMSNSPSKRNILLNKSFTLSSDGVDVPSLDGDAASTKEEPDQSSELADGETQEAGDSVVDLKFPIGTHVYVEYRRIFYSSTILQTRRKRKLREYLVHYEGYKKASDRWVKESNLHEVNAETTRRFDEQRLTSSNIALQPDLSGPADSSMITRGKTNDASDDQSHQHFTRQKKPPSRTRSDASDATKLVDIESGVAFLPGSVVFVELSGALYLAKMVKKRFSGERTEYLVSYDGYDSDYDAWNPIHTIYEVNPQTKRVFNKMNADIKSGIQSKRPDPPKNKPERKKRDSTSTRSSTTVQVEAKSVTKEVFSSPPLPRRRGGRKNDDNDDSISTSDQTSKQSSAAAAAQASFSPVDMQGIPPGVEFLPGSTLFAQRNGALCLAKMLKKRGKGDFMEYFVQFNDGTDNNESLWVSTALVYEINPQTKRMFRQLSNNKS
jgi:3D (Asp-Asp-Asp) domain-containing protein